MVIARIAKFFTKTFIKNLSIWFWSIFFIIFWLTMGAFVFSRGLTREWVVKYLESNDPVFKNLPDDIRSNIVNDVWKRVVTSYSGSWLAVCIVLSFSSTAMGFVSVLFYSVLPIRFISKYSKADETKILAGYIFGSTIILTIQFIILLLSSIAMFSFRFDTRVLPENPLGLFVATLALVLFKFLFALTISLIVIVLRKPRMLTMMTSLPLVVSYALSMLQVYVGGEALNFSPFNSAISLLYYYFTSIEPPYSEPLVTGFREAKTVEPLFAWSVLIAWIAAMLLASIILLRKQKGVSAEELRTI